MVPCILVPRGIGRASSWVVPGVMALSAVPDAEPSVSSGVSWLSALLSADALLSELFSSSCAAASSAGVGSPETTGSSAGVLTALELCGVEHAFALHGYAGDSGAEALLRCMAEDGAGRLAGTGLPGELVAGAQALGVGVYNAPLHPLAAVDPALAPEALDAIRPFFSELHNGHNVEGIPASFIDEMKAGVRGLLTYGSAGDDDYPWFRGTAKRHMLRSNAWILYTPDKL